MCFWSSAKEGTDGTAGIEGVTNLNSAVEIMLDIVEKFSDADKVEFISGSASLLIVFMWSVARIHNTYQ